MSLRLRLLTDDDAPAAWALGSLTFGYHDRPMPADWGVATPGRRTWGAFDTAGRLLGKAVDRAQGHWFGGRVVPASGVAGVAVVADQRGAGIGRAVLTRLLVEARDRGAVISTLFNTTPVPYRRLGWEEVGALVRMTVPARLFENLRPPSHVSIRAATPDDVPAIEELYRVVARASSGMLERSGPGIGQNAEQYLAGWDGVTVAVDAHGPDAHSLIGYVSWDRGQGYDHTGRVDVGDLVGLNPAATVALLSVLGGWASVAPTIGLAQPAADPVPLLTTSASLSVVELRQPWMLRIIDAPGAVAARGWSAHLNGSVELEIDDALCPWHAGRFRLVIEAGEGRLEPGGRGGPTFSARGLALWYAGSVPLAVIRRAGLLNGDAGSDDLLQLATAGPIPTLLDYF